MDTHIILVLFGFSWWQFLENELAKAEKAALRVAGLSLSFILKIVVIEADRLPSLDDL